uniref:Hpr_kinase_C domain-containing protein n=1 Tax=Caenorhabditis tropicalis TaxID=1561998 RepID=A0A1I7UGM8_9PELO
MVLIRLSASSKIERSIVDIHRFPVEEITVSDLSDGIILEMTVNEEERYKIMAEQDWIKEQQLVPLLAYVLSHGDVKKLLSKETENFSEASLKTLREAGRLRVSNFSCSTVRPQHLAILEKGAPGVIKSALMGGEGVIPLEKFIDFESVSKVEKWRLFMPPLETASLIARKWLGGTFEIGTRVDMEGEDGGRLNMFRDDFQDRIMLEGERFIRIRTENPERDICLENIGQRVGHENFVMIVMPAAMVRGSKKYMKFIERENEMEVDFDAYARALNMQQNMFQELMGRRLP